MKKDAGRRISENFNSVVSIFWSLNGNSWWNCTGKSSCISQPINRSIVGDRCTILEQFIGKGIIKNRKCIKKWRKCATDGDFADDFDLLFVSKKKTTNKKRKKFTVVRVSTENSWRIYGL